MRETIRTVIIAASLLCLGVYATAKANQPDQWVMESAYTLDDVTAILNKLPSGKAIDAKVLAINSQRSFMGSLSTPYYVWHRK